MLWLSTGGWLQGFGQGQPSKHVELRRRQVVAHAQGETGLAQQMIAGKILNCRTLLRRNARGEVAGVVASLRRLADQARTAASFSSLLGIEGTAARMYFGALPSMIAPPRPSSLPSSRCSAAIADRRSARSTHCYHFATPC